MKNDSVAGKAMFTFLIDMSVVYSITLIGERGQVFYIVVYDV